VSLTYFPSQSRSDIMESARLHRLLRFMYDGLERVVEPTPSCLNAEKMEWRENISMVWTYAGAEAGRWVSSRISQTRFIPWRSLIRPSNHVSDSTDEINPCDRLSGPAKLLTRLIRRDA